MKKISELFYVKYGTSLELNKLETVNKRIAGETVDFVSRTAKNNGVSAIVKKINKAPFPKGLITVACGGSVLESFVQINPFYSGRDIYILTPKYEMSLKEKLFYCMCIRANKYKYNYGRQANRTLGDLRVPSQVPNWVEDISFCMEGLDIEKAKSNKKINLSSTNDWIYFPIVKLFEIQSANELTMRWAKSNCGSIPYVTTTKDNNGVACYVSNYPGKELYPGNVLTVNRDGNVGLCRYQEKDFYANEKIIVLKPKFKLNKYIAMFFCTIINQELYRYNYGRKCNDYRLRRSKIKLPVDSNGNIDLFYMEEYIKTIKYSNNI